MNVCFDVLILYVREERYVWIKTYSYTYVIQYQARTSRRANLSIFYGIEII